MSVSSSSSSGEEDEKTEETKRRTASAAEVDLEMFDPLSSKKWLHSALDQCDTGQSGSMKCVNYLHKEQLL